MDIINFSSSEIFVYKTTLDNAASNHKNDMSQHITSKKY